MIVECGRTSDSLGQILSEEYSALDESMNQIANPVISTSAFVEDRFDFVAIRESDRRARRVHRELMQEITCQFALPRGEEFLQLMNVIEPLPIVELTAGVDWTADLIGEVMARSVNPGNH